MYVYIHVGTCVNADACTCGGPRLRSGNIFHHSSALLIEARPLSHSQSSQICLLSPSQAEQLVGCQSHSLYYEFCGFELWSSCLQNKHLTTKPCFQLLGVPLLERNYFQYLVSHFEKFPESRQDFKLFLWLIRRKHPVSTRILHLPLNWFYAVDKPNT